MTPSLKISSDLSLPLETVTNTHLILARRRVGKSYTAAVLAEEMIEAGLPWVAMDYTGVWWGLGSSADGKSAGYPIIIIGGPHGHIPLEPSAGKIIANLVVDHPGWYVIDFSRFDHRSDEIRFAGDFGIQLYRRKQRKPSAMHLFVDEADKFVPQKPPKNAMEMLSAYDSLVRQGGVYGIGMTLISQRPALVNKDVTTQCETLIALQTSAPEDQDPVLNWVSRNGTQEQLLEMRKTLASLKVGQAWYFSPDSGIFKKIQIRKRNTFNSSATPKPGVKPIEPKIFSQVDLAALGEEVQASVARTQQEDPAFLRREISRLQTAINSQPRQVQPEPVRIEVPIFQDGELERAEQVVLKLQELGMELNDASRQFKDVILKSREKIETFIAPIPPARRVVKPQETILRNVPINNRLPEGESKLLTYSAQYLDGSNKKQLIVLSGYKRRTVNAYLQALSNKGFIEVNGEVVRITQTGMDTLGSDFEPLPVGDNLRVLWLSTLPDGESKLLSLLSDVYPGSLHKEQLAESTGYKMRTVNAYLQKMNSRRLIVHAGNGLISANSELFS